MSTLDRIFWRIGAALLPVLLLKGSLAAAIEPPRFEEAFVDTYDSGYEQGRCHDNIADFIGRLDASGADVEQVSLVLILNKGFGVFGLVNAEHARSKSDVNPEPGERNWHHHVIAIDSDGYVYDYDFDIEPRVLPLTEYAEIMFLHEPECERPRSGEFCGGREAKLSEYQLRWFSAEDILAENDEEPFRVSTLGEALENNG